MSAVGQSRQPGVYAQDVFAAPAPTFVTGVPIFLGYAPAGPVNQPELVYLWSQFQALYHHTPSATTAPSSSATVSQDSVGSGPSGHLSHAVRGFFDNGGQLCSVIRLNPGTSTGPVPPTVALTEGLQAAARVELADLVCAPDIVLRPPGQTDADHLSEVAAQQHAVLEHCHRLGNRTALLDAVGPGPASRRAEVAAVVAQRRALFAPPGLPPGADEPLSQEHAERNSWGALYHPWVIPDSGGSSTTVPPCGHLAGSIAATDIRSGVHHPPANVALAGIHALTEDLSATEQARLLDAGVNILRALPGQGIRAWGTSTTTTDPDLAPLNVRRLLVTVTRWLEQFLSDLAFEPHTPELWLRVMREVGAFLAALYRQGALRGATPDEAFSVRCDADTNPIETRHRGLLIVDLSFTPVLPAERLNVRVIHGGDGLSITDQPQLGAEPTPAP